MFLSDVLRTERTLDLVSLVQRCSGKGELTTHKAPHAEALQRKSSLKANSRASFVVPQPSTTLMEGEEV